MATTTPSHKPDMFLAVKGKKSGAIKGEAIDKAHVDQIDVLEWSWGVRSPHDRDSGLLTGKRQHQELRVVKKVDKATTALYSVACTNETLTEVVLTVRKGGTAAATGVPTADFLTIKIEQAFIVSLETRAATEGDGHALTESVGFSFKKITISYAPQGTEGTLGATSTFSDEWST